MIEAIGALLTIIGALLVHFLKEKPPEIRREEMDKAIADGDTDTISRLFERLRSKSGRNPIRPNDPPIA